MLVHEEKKRRTFSEAFKREKVKEIESKRMTVSQVSKIYDVSKAAVYKWLSLYGSLQMKKERMVVEKISEAKKTERLLDKVGELEKLLGQKQVEIEYMKKVIEMGNEIAGVDIEKKYVSKC